MIKGIESEVAGDPDILFVPDLESGNMLAKQLSFSPPTRDGSRFKRRVSKVKDRG